MIDKYYRHTVIIKRMSTVDDGGGSKNENWQTYKTIKGMIIMNSATERRSNEKKTVSSTHTLFCAPIDITSSDRIECNGSIYEVNFSDNPLELNHHLEIDLSLIK